jgi:coatomer protein complex subunit epsilon
MSDRDVLFGVKNNFYIGAYNNAINEASDLQGLSDAEQTEKDVFVYRSYIAIGSHDVSAGPGWQQAESSNSILSCCCCWLSAGKSVGLLQHWQVCWQQR